jgi:hypothetical protein
MHSAHHVSLHKHDRHFAPGEQSEPTLEQAYHKCVATDNSGFPISVWPDRTRTRSPYCYLTLTPPLPEGGGIAWGTLPLVVR